MGGCEIFKETGFLLKFIECIVIIALAAIWGTQFYGFLEGHVMYHMAYLSLGATFYFWFPVFIMMIMYAVNGFNDHLYELIVLIVAAVCALLAGIFLLVYHYGDVDDYSYERKHTHRGAGETKYEDMKTSYDENYLICAAVLCFVLTVLYIVDAIIDGAEKKC